jgi:hypothetical protein
VRQEKHLLKSSAKELQYKNCEFHHDMQVEMQKKNLKD